MLLDAEQSCLLLIDMQTKLLPAIHEQQQLTANCVWLLKLAQECGVPIIATEQYPTGLGPTIAELKAIIPEENFMSKTVFSCAADKNCLAKINLAEKPQIILLGIEAHVCVLQTALELKALNKEVFIISDAISSRNLLDKKLALKRMRAAGIHIVSKEMVFFEWLRDSKHSKFKELSKQFLQ